MSVKRWGLATLAGFVVVSATEFVIHHQWLGPFYMAHAEWWRPEAEMKGLMPFMCLAQLSLAALLALVYTKGYESKKGGVGQGVRFGLLLGLLLTVPANLLNYVIYPYPTSLLMSWVIGGLVEATLAGAAIGAVYREG